MSEKENQQDKLREEVDSIVHSYGTLEEIVDRIDYLIQTEKEKARRDERERWAKYLEDKHPDLKVEFVNQLSEKEQQNDQ